MAHAGAATTGTATLTRGSGQVPGGAWLRALRPLLDEVAQPDMQHCGREATFERLPPEWRSALLQVAGAAVRHQAVRPARGSRGTRLRASVTQWSVGGFCGA